MDSRARGLALVHQVGGALPKLLQPRRERLLLLAQRGRLGRGRRGVLLRRGQLVGGPGCGDVAGVAGRHEHPLLEVGLARRGGGVVEVVAHPVGLGVHHHGEVRHHVRGRRAPAWSCPAGRLPACTSGPRCRTGSGRRPHGRRGLSRGLPWPAPPPTRHPPAAAAACCSAVTDSGHLRLERLEPGLGPGDLRGDVSDLLGRLGRRSLGLLHLGGGRHRRGRAGAGPVRDRRHRGGHGCRCSGVGAGRNGRRECGDHRTGSGPSRQTHRSTIPPIRRSCHDSDELVSV